MSIRSLELIEKITAQQDPLQAKILERYFKLQKGEYGEGDRFLGVKVPVIRQIVKEYRDLSLSEMAELLASPLHDIRFSALVILTQTRRYTPEECFSFYSQHTSRINNWDLVDVSAPTILGRILFGKPFEDNRQLLDPWIYSSLLWERRIAVVGTLGAVRKGQIQEAMYVSSLLFQDEHPLMHKAVGWILREVGKKYPSVLCEFLDAYTPFLARTTLRYAIEKMPEDQRKAYLAIPSLRKK